MVVFASSGLIWCAIGAGYMAASVLFLAFPYGDHLDGAVSSSPTAGWLARSPTSRA